MDLFWTFFRPFLTFFSAIFDDFWTYFGRSFLAISDVFFRLVLTCFGPILDIFSAISDVFLRLVLTCFGPILDIFSAISDVFSAIFDVFGTYFGRFLDVARLGQDLHLDLHV